MATLQRIQNREMNVLIGRLSRLIKWKSKKKILKLWKEVERYDFQEVTDELYEKYDDLVTNANDLLNE